MKRLQQWCELKTETVLNLARSQQARQQPERALEHVARSTAARLSEEIMVNGYTQAEAAQFLNLCPRTLRQWQAACRHDALRVQFLGRPLCRAPVHERNQVIDLLDELGPATGLPCLRQAFPTLARAELQDILKRYRRVWKKLNVALQYRLRWPIPGRVWAIDFTEAPCLIDGRYPYLLAVRDLASGNQVLWLPVLDLTALTAQRALSALFASHGAPLVLKMDNGSAFLADPLQQLFALWEVIALFSPPYFPRYNGAAEAGIGSLKTRTENQATLQGHPGSWTMDDVAVAQDDANANARPRGERGPSPADLWSQRQPITTEERQTFHAVLERRRCQVRSEHPPTTDDLLSPRELRSRDRQAISRTLGELGYLLFSRRRIPLPIRKQKVTEI